MRKKQIIVIAFFFTVINVFTAKCVQGYQTSLNHTKETDFLLGELKLRELNSYSIVKHLYGVYRHPHDILRGYFLYIFPNNKFAISKWCDICKEETIDRGFWKYADGKLLLNSSKSKDGEDKKILNEVYGNYYNLNFFVVKEREFVGPSILISKINLEKLKKDRNFRHYFKRIVEFLDWEKIYLELMKSEGHNYTE